MKKLLPFLILILSFPSIGLSAPFAELGVGIGFGGSETEEYSTNNYNHDSYTVGYSFDARAGLTIGNFLDLGATFSYGKNPTKYTREDMNASIFDEARYDVTHSHLLYGGHVGVLAPSISLKIFIEYYLGAISEVTYSEDKGENIFVEGSEFEGDGFGIGFGVDLNDYLRLHGIYRSLTFDSLDANGTSTDLPNSAQDELQMQVFYAGITFYL